LVNVVDVGSNKAHDAGNIALLMSSACFVNVRNETEPLVFFDTVYLISSLMIPVLINLSCPSRVLYRVFNKVCKCFALLLSYRANLNDSQHVIRMRTSLHIKLLYI